MKRMLVSKFLEEPLGEIFDKYKAKWFKDGQFVGLDAVIQSMSGFASDLNAVGADFAKIWETLPESVKSMFEVTADATREASQKVLPQLRKKVLMNWTDVRQQFRGTRIQSLRTRKSFFLS